MTSKIKQQGFTIVELLIVIVVIGILAALVITTFTGIQQQARDTERKTDINALALAMEHKMPTIVFNAEVDGNLSKVIAGETIGTRIG